MKRSNLSALTQKHWVEIEETRNGDGEALSCAIIPTGAGNLMASGLLGFDASQERICTNVFVDFKGLYEDDGEKTPNTLETRKQLYGVTVIENAIIRAVSERQEAALAGEGDAASD